MPLQKTLSEKIKKGKKWLWSSILFEFALILTLGLTTKNEWNLITIIDIILGVAILINILALVFLFVYLGDLNSQSRQISDS